MNIKHIISLAALAVMTAACSSDDITQQPASQSGQTLPFRATITSSAGTRGLTEATDGKSITAAWAEGEKVALVHGVTVDVMEVKSVDNAGNATIEGTVTNITNGETVYLVYTGSNVNAMGEDFKGMLDLAFEAAKDDAKTNSLPEPTAITLDMIKETFGIDYQEGTLRDIDNISDYRLGTSTFTTTTVNDKVYATFATSPTLSAQFVIWMLSLTTDGTTPLPASNLNITCGSNSYEIDPTVEPTLSTFYVLLPASISATYTFKATVGTDTYTDTQSGVSLAAAKFYQSTLKMAKIVEFSTQTANYEAQDGDILTGELGANVKISIADGATVTLNNVTINGVNIADCPWAGITCVGDATIILKDGSTNSVKGFQDNFPGIFVPENKTLTIKGETAGTGTLTAITGGGDLDASYGAGIGGGYNISCGNIEIKGGTITATGGKGAAGIGGGAADNTAVACGNITISGGTITATGGERAAGIGSGSAPNETSSCGDIYISGGTIIATGGEYAAGIGNGAQYTGNPTICGAITITDGVTSVTAKKDATNPGDRSIGASNSGTCGTITIGDTKYWENNAEVNGGDTYLTQNPLVYPPQP